MNLSPAEWIAAVVIGVLSVARTARLLTFDDFPPVVWLRDRATRRLGNTWNGLAICAFCQAPYLTAGMLAWGWLARTDTGLHWTWWVINGWWAAAYVAAIIVAYDQPDSD